MKLPKHIRIEEKMVHGKIVEVKIYAEIGLVEREQDVRPKGKSTKRSASR